MPRFIHTEFPTECTLKDTPTWAVAVVCFVLVLISIVIEHLIHLTGSWLRKRNKGSLYEALEKIKEELMLLGFISLLLTVTQENISEICIPKSVGNSWHPCDKDSDKEYGDKCTAKDKGKVQFMLGPECPHGFGYTIPLPATALKTDLRPFLTPIGFRRVGGKAVRQFVSAYGIHQLHIFIFVLAVFHVVYCILTLGLGTLKMKKWKAWEDETKTLEYQSLHDPERLRYARDTSFGRRHLDFWSHSPVLLWIVCFFRQLIFPVVAKVDYLALRHGFINAHLTPKSQMKFDFWSYINRSLEEDFKVVVEISPILWLFAMLFLLTITRMGLRIQERGEVILGTPVVQTGDYLFWFNRPRLMLFLIHFVLFTNAFQLAFFSWSWLKGLRSCFHRQLEDIFIRLSMGVIIQVLCSYVTLPLYALVTQMGSTMRPTIFNNQHVASSLDNWHRTAKKHAKNGRKSETATSTSQPGTPLHGMSPVHLLNGYRSSTAIGHSLQSSPRKSDGLMIGAWDTEIELSRSPTRHHDYGEDSRMSRWNDQVGDEIRELGATQRVDLESRAAVDGGQREVRIGESDFSFNQSNDRIHEKQFIN